MAKRRRDPDEYVEKRKPCGYEGYCPLVDDLRLYQSQVPFDLRLTYQQRLKLASITIVKWCKRLAALDIHPAPWPICKEAIESAAAEMQAQPPARRTQAFILALYRQGKALEAAETKASLRTLEAILASDEAASF